MLRMSLKCLVVCHQILFQDLCILSQIHRKAGFGAGKSFVRTSYNMKSPKSNVVLLYQSTLLIVARLSLNLKAGQPLGCGELHWVAAAEDSLLGLLI